MTGVPVQSAQERLQQSGEDYDPYVHREVAHSTTNLQTIFHAIKGCLGVGVLAMPEAFKNGGVLVAIIGTLIMAFLITYAIHILVDAQYILCKRFRVPLLTYSESMKVALLCGPQCLKKFANAFAIVVDVFTLLTLTGLCCLYVLFVGLNLKAIVDEYTSSPIALEFYILMILGPYLLILCVRTLTFLAPFSIVANIFTLISCTIILYYVFRDELPYITELPLVGSFRQFPLFLGTACFANGNTVLMVALENNMKTPQDFGTPLGVLNVSMGLTSVIYVVIGFCGFWRYGNDVQPSVTLNLPQNERLANAVGGMYSLGIYLSYGLHCYILVDILWNMYLIKKFESCNCQILLFWEYVIRFLVAIITFTLAATVPLLGQITSLCGALFLGTLAFIFPVIIDICTRWSDTEGNPRLRLFRNVCLGIISTVAILSSAYTNIVDIVKKLSEKNSSR